MATRGIRLTYTTRDEVEFIAFLMVKRNLHALYNLRQLVDYRTWRDANGMHVAAWEVKNALDRAISRLDPNYTYVPLEDPEAVMAGGEIDLPVEPLTPTPTPTPTPEQTAVRDWKTNGGVSGGTHRDLLG